MSDLQTFQQARLSRDPRFDGRFFVAVKTTRIFCRPICPANIPLEKNVEYFVFAHQAMHHGYRPCLRCRPDSAPKSCAWQGVSTTVQRAIQLLHAHVDLSITDIAAKLGIGERYFRQLFKTQIGLSPKQFQLYDQMLMAKQLLHHSNLTIEHIAQACGFSSARRLQMQMQKLCSLSPSQMRKQEIPIEQDIHLKIAFRAPYNWPHLRDFLALRAIADIEHISANHYSRYFTFEEEQGWFSAEYDELHKQFKLHIKLQNLTLLPKVISNIERILDVNADTALINQRLIACGLEPEFLVSGLRLPGVWSTFEAGCRAILGQQISLKAAINLVTLLSQNLGEKQHNGLFFPSPTKVANSDLSFLRIPQSRRTTLQTFATWCVLNPKADVQEWIAIKGIGQWTVAYAQLRGLSLPDVWLAGDLVIKNQLKKFAISVPDACPWRSYLTLQLWTLT